MRDTTYTLVTFTVPVWISLKNGVFQTPFAIIRYDLKADAPGLVGSLVCDLHGFVAQDGLHFSETPLARLVTNESNINAEMPFESPSEIITPTLVVPPKLSN